MLRTTLLISLLLALPAAAAGHEPHEPEDPEDPYYVRVETHDPQTPGEYRTEDDCARGPGNETGPQGVAPSLGFLLAQIHPEETEPNGSVAHLMPTCVVLDTGRVFFTCPEDLCPLVPPPLRTILQAHAAYNVTSGAYSIVLSPLGGAFSGNSGVSLLFDCRDCPPPIEIGEG